MNAASFLISASTAVVGALGCIHLFYTYHGDKLDPRDRAVREAMENTCPVITRRTTMWRANKGFNASHGLGILAFALAYGYLSVRRADVLAGSPFLMALGMAVLLAYLGLALRYFFSTPARAVAVACALYAGGWALS